LEAGSEDGSPTAHPGASLRAGAGAKSLRNVKKHRRPARRSRGLRKTVLQPTGRHKLNGLER
jgi:hypothetical protein